MLPRDKGKRYLKGDTVKETQSHLIHAKLFEIRRKEFSHVKE